MYYTLKEVAEKSKVCIDTARRWAKSGKLKSIKLGKAYRVTDEDLKEFLKKGY